MRLQPSLNHHSFVALSALALLSACGDDVSGNDGSVLADSGGTRDVQVVDANVTADGGGTRDALVASDGSGESDGGPDGSSTTPSLFGWELTATNTGLAPLGLSCDGLAVYSGPGKPAAGTVITERRIETSLDLSNGDIIIERSCIRPTSVGRGLPVVTTTDVNRCTDSGCAVVTSMVTIRDSEIDGSLISQEDIAYSCAFQGVGTIERNYMHDIGSGICFFGTGDSLDAIADGNYVHRLRAFGDAGTTGSHNESFTIRDFDTSENPARRLLVRNNRLDCNSGNDSGALFIQAWAGHIDQVRLEGNLLEGNGYQLVLEANANGYGMNMSAVDNRFSGTGFGPGYVQDGDMGYGWTTWEENYLDDSSRPGNRGTVVSSL